MKVKLLKDIIEEGRLKASVRQNRPTTAFVEGAVVEMSDTSAAKYIKKGLAEPCEQGPAEEGAEEVDLPSIEVPEQPRRTKK